VRLVRKRAPAPKLPLWTGEPMSAADYRALSEAALSERAGQRKLVALLRNPLATNGPVLVFHVPNGFWVPRPAAVAKEVWRRVLAFVWRVLLRDGAMRGACDLVIGWNGRVMLLELKSADGVLSDDQLDFEREAEAAGLDYRTASSLTEACTLLTEWGALK
jgi:hypothetical protein